MHHVWRKKTREEIKESVFNALETNTNFDQEGALGIPASYLDSNVFNQDASFLKDAPFMSALVKNPNHIGCHTLGKSEHFFAGTHAIEKELIEICAVDILHGQPEQQDGYVASGGTEANMQAIWIYRNYFMAKHNAKLDEIAILCSEDSHYSMNKAANLLVLEIFKYKVDFESRALGQTQIEQAIKKAEQKGKKYFIAICNMMTTMFGSVDDVDLLTKVLKENNCEFMLHVDGAYGGFYYPFAAKSNALTFQNTDINSFTLDAHKMAQAPYGTGIFIIRKGMMHYANTKEASYVEGEDFTMIGSRSGANAIAVWMILSTYGPFGWFEKVLILQNRTEWLTKQLTKLGIQYFRHPASNIVAIRSSCINSTIAIQHGLVPDNHISPNWYKVVIMEHVTIEKLEKMMNTIQSSRIITR